MIDESYNEFYLCEVYKVLSDSVWAMSVQMYGDFWIFGSVYLYLILKGVNGSDKIMQLIKQSDNPKVVYKLYLLLMNV